MPNLTVDNLQIFLIFVAPGFIAMRVYDLIVPAGPRSLGDRLLEAVFYSMLNLAVMWWLVVLLVAPGTREGHPFAYYAGTVVVLVASPIGLAVGGYWLRQRQFLKRFFQHPMPTGWDHFFSKRQPCWVLFKLKSGETLGGFYGDDSVASTTPREPEIYVEEVWRVDEYDRFIEQVPRTLGTVVLLSQCNRIEFFEVLRDDEQ